MQQQRVKSVFLKQFVSLLRQGLRADFAERERIISPILFALTMHVLFSFALGGGDEAQKLRIFPAQTFLTLFFALQLIFARVFESDRQDQVFDVLRSYPISYNAWFLAKYAHVLILGLTTLIPTLVIGSIIATGFAVSTFTLGLFSLSLLALAGLGALGVLLSGLTLKAESKQILYALLYFPLSTPVLLAALNASQMLVTREVNETVFESWTYLLLGFDVIYFTLGLLLFSELVSDS